MGIESDQVVFEYLSRVGDLAQQRQVPSAARMRLVAELRNEIDRRRAKVAVDSPAAVRRILARLGTPDEVVASAGGSEAGAPEAPRAAVPVQRESEPEDRPKGLRRVVPRPRAADPAPAPRPDDGPTPPHLAGLDELGDSAGQIDWWQGDGNPMARPQGGLHGSNFDLGDSVPGFVGGVEIPELLKPPPEKEREKPKPTGEPEPKQGPLSLEKELGEEDAAGAEADVPVGRARRRVLPRLRPGGGWNNPLLLLAAALLVAGAVVGSLVPLALGWLIAYLSRRLTPNQSKWAVLGVPGTVGAAWIVWLWGRTEGRWGDPIAEGHMSDAISDTWPWTLRAAAVASALYLLWRSQRPQ
ncbi:hypothetical protein [Streptomyces spongiae]|uniref:Uncharacterized protein n=1 Tax=Streptomyces spongiae TaxID=565072 RepID=A0A5N8XYU5_9ACTN|nr:hypothetical protein [Streptomyces spongiae]MPY64543.1 hypothetical protein [Streptomyces spongiae]